MEGTRPGGRQERFLVQSFNWRKLTSRSGPRTAHWASLGLVDARRRGVADRPLRKGNSEMIDCYFQKLERSANEYLRVELSLANPLAKRCADTAGFEAGNTFAVLPRNEHRNPENFDTGIFAYNPAPRIPVDGGFAQEVQTTKSFVVAWAFDLLRRDSARALIAESYILRRNLVENFANPTTSGALLSGDFAYRLVTSADPVEKVHDALNYVYPVPPGCAVLWRVGEEARNSLYEGRELRTDVLEMAATSVEAILLGAYDGESVLVWTPKANSLSEEPWLVPL